MSYDKVGTLPAPEPEAPYNASPLTNRFWPGNATLQVRLKRGSLRSGPRCILNYTMIIKSIVFVYLLAPTEIVTLMIIKK
jgi:hypothetical protein